MNARTKREFSQRKAMQDAGWSLDLADYVAFNGGKDTESFEHFISKAAIAWVLKQREFRVASEVEGPGGEIDLVAYALEDPPLAIECERSMTDEVMQDKLERYVYGEPFRDMIPVDVDTMPDVEPLREWATQQV